MIACCLEGSYTICLISTLLQLINTQLFACVCIFVIHVLVLSVVIFEQRGIFLFETLSPQTVQRVCIGLSKHVWLLAQEVVDVCGKAEQEPETRCVNNIKILKHSRVSSTKSWESTFSKS